MTTQPHDLEIFVNAQNSSTGGVYYTLSQDPNNLRRYLRQNSTIKTKRNETNIIKFVLSDATQRLLSFMPNPINLSENTDCPQQPGISNGFQARHDMGSGGAVNPNCFYLDCPATSSKRIYGYQLNIVASDGTEFPFDPVIENGGGQGFEQLADSLITGLIGLAAGIGLTYLAGLMGWIHFGR